MNIREKRRVPKDIIKKFRSWFLPAYRTNNTHELEVIRNKFFSLPYGEVALEIGWDKVVLGEEQVKYGRGKIELPMDYILEARNKGETLVSLAEEFECHRITIMNRIKEYKYKHEERAYGN